MTIYPYLHGKNRNRLRKLKFICIAPTGFYLEF